MLSRFAVRSILATAGVGIDGVRGHDLAVSDPGFVLKAFCTKGGTLALGEAYMDGRITARHIDAALEQLARSWLGRLPSFDDLQYWLRSLVSDPQSIDSAGEVAEHYNMSPRMYEAMLGPTMCYTSALGMCKGYSLDQAQMNKVKVMVARLGLREGDRVADIGCGFGTTLVELAHRGARPIGVSNSQGHIDYARERCKRAGVQAEFALTDWREYFNEADHLTSTEMIEAVGRRSLKKYFEWAHWLLEHRDGREHAFSLQAIHISRWWGSGRDGFLGKYIFPGGELPRYRDLEQAWRPYFKLVDQSDFGQDYALTLHAWRANLAKAKTEVVAEITERDYRMMEFYLALCEVSFRLGINSVRQYTLVAK